MPDLPALEHVPALDSRHADPRPWRRWAGLLLDLVFPPFCPVCRSRLDEGRRDPLCGGCWSAVDRIAPPWCGRCGLPLHGFAGEAGALPAAPATRAPVCGPCRRRAPGFDYARAAARYEGVVREAVHALKFAGRRALAAPLGDLVLEAMPALEPPPDLLVPVPLHPRRERERGFNQAALLARRIGRTWGCPVREDVLGRPRATSSQTELDAAARRANVRDAFRVRRAAPVAGRHVILVDDVLTTGATLSECARALRHAGAGRIGALTVARVV